MTPEKFKKLVMEALLQIPKEMRSRLDNVDLVVENSPTLEQLAGSAIDDDQSLLGLYEGIPLTERYGYDMVLPDKITLFQDSIEQICSNDEEIVKEIRDTVIHEIAHHFGMSENKLENLDM